MSIYDPQNAPRSLAQWRRIAASRAPAPIEGETGSGKEIAPRAIPPSDVEHVLAGRVRRHRLRCVKLADGTTTGPDHDACAPFIAELQGGAL